MRDAIVALPAGPGARRSIAVFVLFLLLAVAHTWPLATDLDDYSRHDNADAVLNEWVIAWTAHQLPRNPAGLFDANIFYPEPNTLAFSEHLFVQGVMGAPLLWAGVPSLVVHNLLVILGLALTGWAMSVVMWRWTDDWWASLLAGLLLAFNAHTLTRLAHLQALHMQFFPFAVLALDRLLTGPRLKHALLLAAMYCLQSLTSNYELTFLTFAIVAAALVRPADWLRADKRRTFGLLALAGAISVLVLAPFLVQYLQAQLTQGLTRPLEQVGIYAASWQDYLATGSRLHYATWSAQFWRRAGAALFPGFAALLLTAYALSRPGALRAPVIRMWLAVGLVGLVLSFGVSLPGYSYLYRAIPLLQGIRVSVRFGRLVLVAVAALAAFGLLSLRKDPRLTRRWRLCLSVAAIVLVTLEAARLPVGYSPEPPYRVPAVYHTLAAESNAVVVELPLYPPREFYSNKFYMLNATVHWKPILNGYSGFRPASYARHWQVLRDFPDRRSIDMLQRVGVTHIVVHERDFTEMCGKDAFDRIATTPGLRLMSRWGDIWIYRVERSLN